MSIKKQIVAWLFPSVLEEAYQLGIKEGRFLGINDTSERLRKEKHNCDVFSIEQDIGQKIIVVGNEWEDPIFAIVIGVAFTTSAKQPMAEIENVLTGDKYLAFPNGYYHADFAMVSAILKLDPFERWNLYGSKGTPNMWNKWYPKESITPPEVLREKLLKVGFI